MKKEPKSKKVRSPLRVGAKVFIRTVTHYHTGRVVALDATQILLVDAAWIADTGRWNHLLKTGFAAANEVEPFEGPVSVARGSVVDVTEWKHDLPASVK